jgi:hypothetical protein
VAINNNACGIDGAPLFVNFANTILNAIVTQQNTMYGTSNLLDFFLKNVAQSSLVENRNPLAMKNTANGQHLMAGLSQASDSLILIGNSQKQCPMIIKRMAIPLMISIS